MTGVPSFAQIQAQVKSIRDRYPDARAIGIGLPALDDAETAPSALRIGSEELPVARCGSVLALRERLVDLPAAGPPLVVLTDLPATELGEDVRARLAHRKLFSIEAWQLVKERFKAQYVDPRLADRHEWAARALLDAEPETGYSPAPSGFLDAETAWRRLFEALAGIPRGERDPEALLAWALDGDAVQNSTPCRKRCGRGWRSRRRRARAARRGRFSSARDDSGAGPSPSVSWRGSCSIRTGRGTNGRPRPGQARGVARPARPGPGPRPRVDGRRGTAGAAPALASRGTGGERNARGGRGGARRCGRPAPDPGSRRPRRTERDSADIHRTASRRSRAGAAGVRRRRSARAVGHAAKRRGAGARPRTLRGRTAPHRRCRDGPATVRLARDAATRRRREPAAVRRSRARLWT